MIKWKVEIKFLILIVILQIYGRLLRGLNEIEDKIPFSHDDRLGYLTFCPTNLGTTIRASVLIRIPKLLAKKDILDDISKRHNLQVRIRDVFH